MPLPCPINSIDSNFTGTRIAQELCPKELDAVTTNQKWYTREPNAYANLGGNNTAVAREPIIDTRQDLKGSIVDVEAAAAWSEDFTQDNMTDLLQGFFFNNAYEKYNLKPLQGTDNLCADVEAANGVYNVTSTLASLIFVDDLVLATGFGDTANNGLSLVEAVTVTALDTDNASSVLDAAPSFNANVRVVGHEFATGDLVATLGTGTLILTSATKDMTELNLNVGEYIFIGGDAAASQFDNGTGYARILSISTTAITFDKSTGLILADAGAGKDIRIFFGTYERNGLNSSEVITRTYAIERTLGDDANGTQAQVEVGSFANEFSLKIPSAAKLEADLSYVSMDELLYDGTQIIPSEVAGVQLFAALGQDAYNTSSDMIRITMNKVPVVPTLSPTADFAFVTEVNININNGATLNKAVGTIGGISASFGNFKLSGSITAYFQTVEAQRALRNSDPVTIDVIFARSNAGFIYDVPLLTLGGGLPNVTKDSPITLPLDILGAKGSTGYTMSYCNLQYLPTVAMPA